jgi:hypothetical protein
LRARLRRSVGGGKKQGFIVRPQFAGFTKFARGYLHFAIDVARMAHLRSTKSSPADGAALAGSFAVAAACCCAITPAPIKSTFTSDINSMV